MPLYPYQQEFIDNVKKELIKGKKRIMCQSPTGSGKTFIMSTLAKMAVDKGGKVLLLTHREELYNQNGSTLTELGLSPEYIGANTRKINESNIYVAMVLSLKNRLAKEAWQEVFKTITMIIIDEAHFSTFDYIFDNPLSKDKYIFGFTATPLRTSNQRSLDTMYESIVLGKDVQELINMGFLVTDRYYSVPVDVSSIKTKGGDFDTTEMFDKYNTPELYSGVIDNWKRICPEAITIVFCVNIQHTINTCKAFNEAGIKAKFIVSKIKKSDNEEYLNYINNFEAYSGERSEIIKQFKNGEFNVLVNSGVLTAGFDYKPISCVIINRATKSDNLLMQIIGRGSRIYPNKDFFYILDFGENCKRLGYYRQQREYSLDKKEQNNSDGGIAGSKECPQCHSLLFVSSKSCKYCGYVFPKTRKDIIVELVELPYKEALKQLETVLDYELYCEAKGYNKNWLHRTIYHRFGVDGLREYSIKHSFDPKWVYRTIKKYEI